MVVCDGLRVLSESINTAWSVAVVRAFIIHLISNTFRYASRKCWDALAKGPAAALYRFHRAGRRGQVRRVRRTVGRPAPGRRQPLAGRVAGVHPVSGYDAEIRRVICSTNAIESLNALYRRAVRARGHFPTEQTALKCLYLVTRSLDPTGNPP